MTENNELPEAVTQEPEQSLPGRKLREAREARKLSREEVAAQLRLNVRLITALEEDDYDALPAQTFVSGYLRSYARLLELPEDSVAAPAVSKSEPPPLVSRAASRKQASSRDALTRLVTYLIVAAIAVSVVMWWLAQRQVVETELSAPEPEITEQGGNLSMTLPEPVAGAGETTAEISMPQVDVEAEAPANTLTEMPAEPETTAPAQEQTAGNEVEEESVAEEQGEPEPLTDAMPQSKLELRYQADSWTEISDNAGRQLAYGLITAGDVLVLRGEAPFRVFLGYAPGVTVYYNNDLFDHSPFQRRDVARFRIGRAEHNHPGSR